MSAIYGPNGGGKSNVLAVLHTLMAKELRPLFVTEDSEEKVLLQKEIIVEPFAFSESKDVYDKDSFPAEYFNGVEERANSLNKINSELHSIMRHGAMNVLSSVFCFVLRIIWLITTERISSKNWKSENIKRI